MKLWKWEGRDEKCCKNGRQQCQWASSINVEQKNNAIRILIKHLFFIFLVLNFYCNDDMFYVFMPKVPKKLKILKNKKFNYFRIINCIFLFWSMLMVDCRRQPLHFFLVDRRLHFSSRPMRISFPFKELWKRLQLYFQQQITKSSTSTTVPWPTLTTAPKNVQVRVDKGLGPSAETRVPKI